MADTPLEIEESGMVSLTPKTVLRVPSGAIGLGGSMPWKGRNKLSDNRSANTAWVGGWEARGDVRLTDDTAHPNGTLFLFTQAPPVVYGQLGRKVGCCGARLFDPAALWLWTVLGDRARQGKRTGSFAGLARDAGVPRTTANRLVAQLVTGGMIEFDNDGNLWLRLPPVEEVWRNLLAAHGEAAGHPIAAEDLKAELGRVWRENDAHSGQVGAHYGRASAHDGHRARSRHSSSHAFSRRTAITEEQARASNTPSVGDWPDWADGEWWVNLQKRYGKEEAEAAVVETVWRCRQQDITSPRAYATKMARIYAGYDSGAGGRGRRMLAEHRQRRIESGGSLGDTGAALLGALVERGIVDPSYFEEIRRKTH